MSGAAGAPISYSLLGLMVLIFTAIENAYAFRNNVWSTSSGVWWWANASNLLSYRIKLGGILENQGSTNDTMMYNVRLVQN